MIESILKLKASILSADPTLTDIVIKDLYQQIGNVEGEFKHFANQMHQQIELIEKQHDLITDKDLRGSINLEKRMLV